MDEFQGKTAFVTGAASGIGRGLAERFASEGMNVVLADIETAALDATVRAISATGARVEGVECDVSKKQSVEAAAAKAIESFGPVHLVCNNAGISTFGPLVETTAGDWDWTIGVNLMGVVHGIQTFVPHMLEHSEGGHVLNTASIGGLMPLAGCGVYTATKYAVVGISEVLKLEVAHQGIGVSVLCPFFVNTRLHESARNLPGDYDATTAVPDFIGKALGGGSPPAEIAEAVVKGIRANQLHILPHPESRLPIEARMNGVMAAFDR